MKLRQFDGLKLVLMLNVSLRVLPNASHLLVELANLSVFNA